MEFFDVLYLYGFIASIVMAVPHIIFVKTRTYDLRLVDNRAMLYIERTGKYASFFLMGVNIGVLESGYTEPKELMEMFWLVSVGIMLAVYVLLWIFFLKKESKGLAIAMTVLASVIIMFSGILQVKTLLLTAGAVYLIGELYVVSKLFKR